jgi:hypothetical protein
MRTERLTQLARYALRRQPKTYPAMPTAPSQGRGGCARARGWRAQLPHEVMNEAIDARLDAGCKDRRMPVLEHTLPHPARTIRIRTRLPLNAPTCQCARADRAGALLAYLRSLRSVLLAARAPTARSKGAHCCSRSPTCPASRALT